MLKKLKMLLKLRAWIRSDTLKAGGIIGFLGALQTFVQSDDGMGWVDWVANIIGLTSGTLSGILLGIAGLVTLIYRAKTEWGLDEKVAGKDKAPQGGFTTLGALLLVCLVGVVAILAVPRIAHADEVKTFTYSAPDQYTNGDALPASDLASFELGCGDAPGNYGLISRTWAAGVASRQETIPNGNWFCALRAITTANATFPNQTSDWSNEVNFTVPTPRPVPINDLSVT